ncbi:MAG: hypothetical protein JNL38_23780 [Myxococcales bacterium]|nr:hypothetical protein [Myxococcales bacterium]
MRARPAIAAPLVAVAVTASAPARALDAEVTSDTAVQFYEVRSPSGQNVLARRRLTTTLGVGAYDLLDRSQGPREPELSFRARLRYDADYGADAAETDPGSFDRLVPGYSRGPVDLMYGYVEGRRFAKGWLGFRLGRQYTSDMLGWWSFDGALARVTTPFYAAGEVYAGLEQRGGLPLSTARYEREGIWRGSRTDIAQDTWAPFQQATVAPAFGATAETVGLPWIHARVAYRRVENTGTSNVSMLDSGTVAPTTYRGLRLSSERVGAAVDGTLAEHGGVKAGLSYDMYMRRLATAFASVDWFATKKLTASLDYDFFQPSYDADSIWNFFQAAPTNDVGARASYDASDRLSVAGGARVRVFRNQTEPDDTSARPSPNFDRDSTYYPSSSSYFNGGGDASARYKWGSGVVGARVAGDFGGSGQRAGGDVYGERVLETRYVVNGRAGLWEWDDKLRPGRDAVGFNYVAGLGYILMPDRSRVLVEWDHAMNRVSGQRFRLMLWLTVAVAK